MNSKERVKAALNWLPPDRIPVHEDFWTDTISTWKDQGLPAGTDERNIGEYFDFDIAVMYLDSSPRYEQKILERKGENYIYEDRFGYTAEKPWMKSGSIHYLSTVTEDRDRWEREVKPRFRFDPDESSRIDDSNYFEHFAPYPTWEECKGLFEKHRELEKYILFKNYGPWEASWRHRDFTRLLMDIALDPDWVADMAWTQTKLSLRILEHSLELGMKPDGYLMVDDLGGGTGPLISPDMWREVMGPPVRMLGNFLEAEGIDFWMHSCGNAELLYEDLIDCGVRVMNPLQVTAGLDIREMAERYRGRLAFYGNIDAHLLGKDWAPLEEALKTRKEMFTDGGWICHTDHSIPPDMSLADYRRMVELIRS